MDPKVRQYLILKKEFDVEIADREFAFVRYLSFDGRPDDVPEKNGFSKDKGWVLVHSYTDDGLRVYRLAKFWPMVTKEEWTRIETRRGDHTSWSLESPWESFKKEALEAYTADVVY